MIIMENEHTPRIDRDGNIIKPSVLDMYDSYCEELVKDVTIKRSVCAEADVLINGERQESYGHPAENFTRTAQMWSAILGFDVSAADVGLCMVALKLAREANAPSRDNLVDIAGYAGALEKLEEYDD